MKSLHYEVTISAPPADVWVGMLRADNYAKWVKAFSENSQFIGEWKQGASIQCVDPGMGGTKAILEVFDPPNRILAKHIALIGQDGSEDVESKMAKTWIGTQEEYVLEPKGEATRLKILMTTDDDFADMFDRCWPEALSIIKSLFEAP